MIGNVLRHKVADVFTASADDTLESASRTMSRHRVAALFVLNAQGVEGLISEREIIDAVAADGALALRRPVRDVMRRQPPVVSASDTLRHAMHLMTQHKLRHLAVLDGAKVVGVVSIGDVVKSRLEDLEAEANVLRDVYIAGAH
jgi:CBS domain-containing protein